MTIGFLGVGVMGESILRGVLAAGTSPLLVQVADRRAERAHEVARQHGVVEATPAGLAAAADLLLVAVKPGDVPDALAEVGPVLRPDAVVVSVAAGLTTATLEQLLPPRTPVVRAMPNTPALVGAGVTAICPGSHAAREQVQAAAALLATVGTVVEVAEGQMDAVTAVSGSGPAYLFLVVEALVEAGVRAGLGRDLATRLVLATLDGSARMLAQTGEHPAVLRERVTSPGGTTAAALHRLEAHGLRAAFLDAVLANRDRAREIAEGLG
jgi:pyrroline-5-carboxylate reductase